MKWTKKEEKLLVTLRSKNVPYREKVEFFEGKTQDALRNKMHEIRNRERMEDEKITRIGVWDIETTDWNADAGFMLGWAIYYPHDNKTVSHFVDKKEMYDYKFDKRICRELVKEFENIDLLVTYYGSGFDIPFARTRCLINGVRFPHFGEMRHRDCYYVARGKVKTRKKSLGVIAEALGLDAQKTHESVSVWNLAKYGHPASIRKIQKYCENDVVVTWDVYEELKKYGKYTTKSI